MEYKLIYLIKKNAPLQEIRDFCILFVKEDESNKLIIDNILNKILETNPELEKELDNKICDILDMLHGYCHPDCRI